MKSDLIPANGTFFSLAEAFNLIQAENYNVNTFWTQATDEKIHGKNIQLVCARSSFFRRWKKFQTEGVTPSPGDYGIRVGAPRIVDDNQLHLVNDQLKTTVGLAGDNSDLTSSLVSVNEILKEKAGAFPYLKSPCTSTIKLYQVLTVDQDKDLHLVRDRNMKVKDKRRQMALISQSCSCSFICKLSSSCREVGYT